MFHYLKVGRPSEKVPALPTQRRNSIEIQRYIGVTIECQLEWEKRRTNLGIMRRRRRGEGFNGL
jgi:hypothetical protein